MSPHSYTTNLDTVAHGRACSHSAAIPLGMSDDKQFDKQETPRTAEVALMEPDNYMAMWHHAKELERELAIVKDDLETQCRAWWKAASPYATPKALREALSAREDSEAIQALRELIACKDLRDRIDKIDDPMNWKDPPGLDDLKYEYLRRKPLAWQRAREIMSRYVGEKK